MLDLLSPFIFRRRPVETTRHAKVVEPVKRDRRIGLEHNPIIISRLASDIQENLERDEVEPALVLRLFTFTLQRFLGRVESLQALHRDVVPVISHVSSSDADPTHRPSTSAFTRSFASSSFTVKPLKPTSSTARRMTELSSTSLRNAI